MDDIGDGERLARPRDAEQDLFANIRLDTANQAFDRLWLIAGGLKGRGELEWALEFSLNGAALTPPQVGWDPSRVVPQDGFESENLAILSASDTESAFMDIPVMAPAQENQIVQISWATVSPMDEVMRLAQ